MTHTVGTSSSGRTTDCDGVDGPAIDEAVAALRSLVLATQTFRQSFASYTEVGVVDTLAMSHLAAAGSLSARELADRIGLATSSVTALIDRLERAGLAVRVARVADRRVIDVRLTEDGHRALDLAAHWTRAALLDLGLAELPALIDQLRRLGVALSRRAAEFETATTDLTRAARPHLPQVVEADQVATRGEN